MMTLLKGSFLSLLLLFSVISSAYAGGGRVELRAGADNYINRNISLYATVHKPDNSGEINVGEPFEVAIRNPRPGDVCTISQSVSDANGTIQADCTATTPGDVTPYFKSKADGYETYAYVLHFLQEPTPTPAPPTPTKIVTSTPTTPTTAAGTLPGSTVSPTQATSASASISPTVTPTKILVDSSQDGKPIVFILLILALLTFLGALFIAIRAFLQARKRPNTPPAPPSSDAPLEVNPQEKNKTILK